MGRDALSLGFSMLLLSLPLLQEKQTNHALCFPEPNVEAFWNLINQPPVLSLAKPRDLIRHSPPPFVSHLSAHQFILLPLRLSVGGWSREEAGTPSSRAIINTHHTQHIISQTHTHLSSFEVKAKAWSSTNQALWGLGLAIRKLKSNANKGIWMLLFWFYSILIFINYLGVQKRKIAHAVWVGGAYSLMHVEEGG